MRCKSYCHGCRGLTPVSLSLTRNRCNRIFVIAVWLWLALAVFLYLLSEPQCRNHGNNKKKYRGNFRRGDLKQSKVSVTADVWSEMCFQVCRRHTFISLVRGVIDAHSRSTSSWIFWSGRRKCKHGENAQYDAWTGLFDRRCHNWKWAVDFGGQV